MVGTAQPRLVSRLALSLAAIGAAIAFVVLGCTPAPPRTPLAEVIAAAGDLGKQSDADVQKKSAGCLSCHTKTDAPTMHEAPTVKLGCTDCHGGNATAAAPAGSAAGQAEYEAAKKAGHVQPRLKGVWKTSANPERLASDWLRETWEYVRFVNPGDFRVARATCGTQGCHPAEVAANEKSMMTTGAMLWGAIPYNNGSFPLKIPRFGESYGPEGIPQRVQTVPPPTQEETFKKGVLPYLDPLPRFEIGQPGNMLRIFERGQRRPFEIGLPILDEDPGRPGNRLSARGLGTGVRVDPVWIGLQKTRLLDPILSMLGTNDHPGDYRSSGCSACHVVYANDRFPEHSGPYAAAGHLGRTQTQDPTIPKTESGHPVKHTFTRAIPSSQCIVCHIHPGTNMVMTYLGYIWWDNETDGEVMYPKESRRVTPKQRLEISDRNPEGSALRGLWSDRDFLVKTSELNPQLQRTQFADFHGHGWMFRAIFKQDRKGNLLDREGTIVPFDAPDKWKRAVHLKDIHLEKGMHCIDCHFKQDTHGNGKLYGETRNAVEIDCRDCHGTVNQRATLKTSAAAAPEGGTDLATLSTPFGQRRFTRRGDVLIQRSMVVEGTEWEVPETIDTVTPGHPRYRERSRLAKTIRRDGTTWGDVPPDQKELAHADARMTCFTCHSSWMTTCAGCHLPLRANEYRRYLHHEGEISRNWTQYNFQVIRDDAFQLGIDGNVTGNRIAPVRSSSAVLVSSQNLNREWVYSQQQTVSAEGYSGQAFNTHVPHTVRGRESKQCSDCHPSEAGDNNALMAQLLLQGTNLMNFLGRYIYVAEGKAGWEAVIATEQDEPQAVLGSRLHELAYPDEYTRHVARGGMLTDAYRHRGPDIVPFGGDDVRSIQLRGEFLYTANGPGGLRVYDVAQIDQKGFSQRVFTAPVSPLGQRFYVRTQNATAVVAPATLAVDPARSRRPENAEQPIHPLYAFLYVTDAEEGLILVNAATLLDGDPDNNFLKRDVVFNPNGALDGAVNLTVAGRYVYVLAKRGLVVVDVDNPLQPQVVAEVGAPHLVNPRAIAVQFRYAFVTDQEGLKVIDVTQPARPRPVQGAVVPLTDAQGLYVARAYAYVAAGAEGLAIVDVEKPEAPRLDQMFTADGTLNDARDVKVGMTNASAFAYVADGRNGLRVLQLFSPRDAPNVFGFIVRPSPRLIATSRTAGPALAVSKGLDRDRAADESGNQVGVFGRWGARPFNRAEMERLYLKPDGTLRTVRDTPPSEPRAPAVEPEEEEKKEEEPAAPRRPRRSGG
jgi:LVIVD repeat